MVLNASYEPLTIVSAQRAVTLVLNGKAVIVESSDKVYRSAHHTISVPYVVKLTYYVHRNIGVKPAAFSKATVLVRDGRKCAYCAKPANTVDHILPRKLGGKDSYENCVAACGRCNTKKADMLLKDAGFTLRVKPYAPTQYSMFLSRVLTKKDTFEAWSKYVFMYQPELEEIFVRS
jgi:5-methylcytosine-specific restriction endonuclease McrA